MTSSAEILEQGRAHHQAGRVDQARELYEVVLARDPDHAEALHLLGCISFYQGNDAEALELIGRAIAKKANVGAFHLTQGNVLRHAGRTEEALISIDRALHLKPDFADAYCVRGDILLNNGNRKDAVAAYHQVLALSPADSELIRYATDKLNQAHSYAVTPVEQRHIHWLSYVSSRLSSVPEAEILDIGSEIFWLLGIAAKFPQLVAIDIRSHPCSDMFPFRHIRADILDLPFDDSSFDVITMPQVLHWVGSGCYGQKFADDVTGHALSEVARVLRPGGCAIGATFVKPGSTSGVAGSQRTFGVTGLPGQFATAGLQLSDAQYYLHETMTAVELDDISADRERDIYPYPRYVSPYYMLFELIKNPANQ